MQTLKNAWRGLTTIAAALSATLIGASSPAFAFDISAPRVAGDPQIRVPNPYAAKLTPFMSRDNSSSGFGLFASSGHRTVNLAQPTSWALNPDASTSGTAVGLGWRARNMSATMGYVRPASSTDAFTASDGVQRFRPRSMVGVGFALHY